MTNVVIASAARTPVGSFLGSFANTPAHELGRVVIEAVVERAGVDKAEVSETILGQVLTAAQGQNPRVRRISTRASRRKARPGHQPGLRLGPARRGAGRAAHHAGRRRHRRGRRSGKHVHEPPCRRPAAGPEDGRHEVYRHDDPRRPVGRVQRLPHGSDGRERGRAMADLPRYAGRVRRRLPEQGGGRAEGRQVRRRDLARHDQDPQGRHRGRQ
jgi:hypothetical protein